MSIVCGVDLQRIMSQDRAWLGSHLGHDIIIMFILMRYHNIETSLDNRYRYNYEQFIVF
jgi:hypothetical protein